MVAEHKKVTEFPTLTPEQQKRFAVCFNRVCKLIGRKHQGWLGALKMEAEDIVQRALVERRKDDTFWQLLRDGNKGKFINWLFVTADQEMRRAVRDINVKKREGLSGTTSLETKGEDEDGEFSLGEIVDEPSLASELPELVDRIAALLPDDEEALRVLAFMAEGGGPKEIADKLGISENKYWYARRRIQRAARVYVESAGEVDFYLSETEPQEEVFYGARDKTAKDEILEEIIDRAIELFLTENTEKSKEFHRARRELDISPEELVSTVLDNPDEVSAIIRIYRKKGVDTAAYFLSNFMGRRLNAIVRREGYSLERRQDVDPYDMEPIDARSPLENLVQNEGSDPEAERALRLSYEMLDEERNRMAMTVLSEGIPAAKFAERVGIGEGAARMRIYSFQERAREHLLDRNAGLYREMVRRGIFRDERQVSMAI